MGSWKYCLEKSYDTAICIFSILDVFFDMLVTYQFYIEGHTYFLGLSLFILFAAQVSYAVFMACALEPIHKKETFIHRYNVLIFFVWLPIAQIVPLFLMFYSSYPRVFDKYFTKFGYTFQLSWNDIDLFNAGTAALNNDNIPQSSHENVRYLNDIEFDEMSFRKKQIKMNDPFSNFIRSKLVSHFGFIIEAVIESIPQSIVQMIYLIMYHSASNKSNTLNILSIVMSMTVVSSKGTLLSYSIYRKASIFNFLCFAMDIFGIFTVCSWLFVFENDSTANNYEFLGYHLWYVGYYYFNTLYYIYVTLLWIAFWAFNLLLIETYKKYWDCPWRGVTPLILLPVAATLLIIPVSLICLTVRFTLIPLFVLHVFDHSQNRSYAFYNKIYSFIAESTNLQQIHEKILLTNWMIAQLICQSDETQHLCDDQSVFIAHNLTNEMQWYYDRNGDVSLSQMYGILHKLDLNFWIHYKCHQLFEVIALLVSKKGFWKFIALKLSPHKPSKHYLCFMKALFCFCWTANDIDMTFNNSDKYNEFEIEFWKTMQQIQEIINWDHFIQTFTRHWTQFLFHLHTIRVWFHNLHWRNVIRNGYHTCVGLWGLFALWLWKNVRIFVEWFCYGLKHAILQDCTNLYYSFLRCADKSKIPNKYNRTALTLNEHFKFSQNPNAVIRYRNTQSLQWNLPKCWCSYNALFKDGIIKSAYINSYVYYENISDENYNYPWVGRGVFVFVIVIIFKCIHCPLRRLYTNKAFEDFCAVMIAFPSLIIVLPLLFFIAFYSIIAPILFLIQHLLIYGLFGFGKHNLLQIIFTFCYLIIFVALFVLIPKVWKFVYSDFHLYRYFNDKQRTPANYADYVREIFVSKEIRNALIEDSLGCDIGGVLKTYLPYYQTWKYTKKL